MVFLTDFSRNGLHPVEEIRNWFLIKKINKKENLVNKRNAQFCHYPAHIQSTLVFPAWFKLNLYCEAKYGKLYNKWQLSRRKRPSFFSQQTLGCRNGRREFWLFIIQITWFNKKSEMVSKTTIQERNDIKRKL